MIHSERMMYVELKSGFSHDGPAWIGRVGFSKTGHTIYYRGKTLKRLDAAVGNFVDVETGDEYWVSHVARDGIDRHWAGAGTVQIEWKTRLPPLGRPYIPRIKHVLGWRPCGPELTHAGRLNSKSVQ